jgi:Thaumarchaeal output domain 1
VIEQRPLTVEPDTVVAADSAPAMRTSDTVVGQSATVLHSRDTVSDGSATAVRWRDVVVDGRREMVPDQRRDPRFVLRRPLIGVPVMPDGRPYPGRPISGMVADVSRGGLGLEFEAREWRPAIELVVGVETPNGPFRFAGVRVRYKGTVSGDRLKVGCEFGGFGQQLLQADTLAPRFVAELQVFAAPFPTDLLDAWCAVGVLKVILTDRVQLCPQCHALPTFRPGCRRCGSANVANDQLIHHYACAHVGRVSDFQTPAGLVCPKCRTRHLIVSSDYEYVTGPYQCRQCQWSDTELEQVAQCLRCGVRFPGHQAYLQDLRDYRADRLDPLALLPSP